MASKSKLDDGLIVEQYNSLFLEENQVIKLTQISEEKCCLFIATY